MTKPALERLLRHVKMGGLLCAKCLGNHIETPSVGYVWLNEIDGDADRVGYCAAHKP